MNFEEIIDKMEEVLESAWRLPMSGGRSVVDSVEIENLIQELKVSLPSAIAEANRIIENKEQIIKTAKNNCEEIYKVAKQKVQSMVDEHEIVRLAKKKEAEIKENLVKQSKEFAANSREKINKSLDSLESSLVSTLEKIHESKKALRDIR